MNGKKYSHLIPNAFLKFLMMKKKNLCYSIKTMLFIFGFILLFFLWRRLSLPKWNYPKLVENTTFSISTFYNQQDNVDDVVFLGTSHTLCGVAPMDIYKNTGIISYNIGTSAQGIAETYPLTRKVLKSQKPKVLVLDVSSLFFSNATNEYPWAWEYIITSIPGLHAASQAIIDYYKGLEGKELFQVLLSLDFWKQLLPMQYFSSRWKEIGWTDVRDMFVPTSYFTAGYCMYPSYYSSGETIEDMNDLANSFAEDGTLWKDEYIDGSNNYEQEESILYQVSITEENARILSEISDLCDESGTELLLVKYPTIRRPNAYTSAWTKIKSDYMKQFALDNGYKFLDLLYDVDLGMDIDHDFHDGGGHLNYSGAKKISEYLGQYLQKKYDLESKSYEVYDKNMALYDVITDLAETKLVQDLPTYLDRLKERNDRYVICMAASDDMKSGLDEKDILALQKLGFQSDFINTLHTYDSFIGLIDGGNVLYEGISNRTLSREESVSEKIKLAIISSGWNVGSEASIMINGKECASNSTGLNIVVIDKESGLVVDSVVFNTHEATHQGLHKDSMKYLDDYWMHLMYGYREHA